MIKLFLILILPFYLFFSKDEEKSSSFDCDILQGIVQTPIFNSQFYLSKYPEDIFYLVDTNNLFSHCNTFDQVYNRNVTIIYTLPTRVEMMKNPNYVIIAMQRRSCVLSIGFFCPANGSHLVVQYLEEGDEYLHLGFKIGDI